MIEATGTEEVLKLVRRNTPARKAWRKRGYRFHQTQLIDFPAGRGYVFRCLAWRTDTKAAKTVAVYLPDVLPADYDVYKSIMRAF